MNNKKNFKDLVKPQVGRPRIGKDRRYGKTLSLSLEEIAFLESKTPAITASEVASDLIKKKLIG